MRAARTLWIHERRSGRLQFFLTGICRLEGPHFQPGRGAASAASTAGGVFGCVFQPERCLLTCVFQPRREVSSSAFSATRNVFFSKGRSAFLCAFSKGWSCVFIRGTSSFYSNFSSTSVKVFLCVLEVFKGHIHCCRCGDIMTAVSLGRFVWKSALLPWGFLTSLLVDHTCFQTYLITRIHLVIMMLTSLYRSSSYFPSRPTTWRQQLNVMMLAISLVDLWSSRDDACKWSVMLAEVINEEQNASYLSGSIVVKYVVRTYSYDGMYGTNMYGSVRKYAGKIAIASERWRSVECTCWLFWPLELLFCAFEVRP